MLEGERTTSPPVAQPGMAVTLVLWQHLLLLVILLKHEVTLSNGEMMSGGSLVVQCLKKTSSSQEKLDYELLCGPEYDHQNHFGHMIISNCGVFSPPLF